MFKFLKEKLKSALGKITKKVEEEAPEEIVEQPVAEVQETQKKPKTQKKAAPAKKKEEKEKKQKKTLQIEEKELPSPEKEIPTIPQKPELEASAEEQPQEKKGFFTRLFKKKEEHIETPSALEEKEILPEPAPAAPEKKGFFGKLKEKIVTKKITTEQFEELFWELEVVLLENNVAVAVIDYIKQDLKKHLVDQPLPRGQVLQLIEKYLRESIHAVLAVPTINLIDAIKSKKDKPYIIVFFGVNGAGKTTTIARVAYLLQSKKLQCVLVAADTFRAGAKEQLEAWGKKLDVKVISHNYNADPAAVAFDGITYAQQQKLDVVLIDTAGRQHSNINLVKQMEKIVRVAKPDLKLFVGEAITGNDVVEQSQQFHQSIGIDGVILTKSDIDEKGGAIVSVSYIIKKPILYLGVGQRLEDLEPFNPEHILERIGLSS